MYSMTASPLEQYQALCSKFHSKRGNKYPKFTQSGYIASPHVYQTTLRMQPEYWQTLKEIVSYDNKVTPPYRLQDIWYNGRGFKSFV
jgi:hypothetical protein